MIASRRLISLRVASAMGFAMLAGAVVPAPAAAAVTLQEVASGFVRPIYVTHAGDSRLFVVEQGGKIWVLNGGTKKLFLDISGRVVCCGEQGLLGLAFHPDYATNRLFYINYTRKSDGGTVIAEHRRSAADPDMADPGYRRRVLRFNQPYANHNGGWMSFKGNGKRLFISTGDGGGAGDPLNKAQRKSTWHGKILRINPRGSGPGDYKVPKTNPFVGKKGRDEVWAYGLRNPWRCSFDLPAGKLWCADVGQDNWEEINRVKGGVGGINYGWRVMEGRHCYKPATGCNTSGKRLPIAEYAHGGFGGGNCSVTGGYVARRAGAALFGKYIFGDFCSGKLWTIDASHRSGGALPAPTETGRRISSFGEGHDGRIYMTDLSNGTIYYVEGT